MSCKREKPDSDNEIERELEETEAAVDACIQEGKKRAGVNVVEPERACMSEMERDCICEDIGDEPGARAKRRKEIEYMSEEDIETEIRRMEAAMTERVESAARRKQGLDMGRLPWIMIVLGLIGGQSRPAEAFTAYDCLNRSNIISGARHMCDVRKDRGSRQPCMGRLYK
jgi:hypothetical protein